MRPPIYTLLLAVYAGVDHAVEARMDHRVEYTIGVRIEAFLEPRVTRVWQTVGIHAGVLRGPMYRVVHGITG